MSIQTLDSLLDYFGRIAVIHLPSRTDRYQQLVSEFKAVGIDINDPRVVFPDPPMPPDANGFKSRGVYGNFLSHLQILESALTDGLEAAWVLEDDAIFSHRFKPTQARLVRHLRENTWDTCFLGHSIMTGLPRCDSGLVRFAGPFIWAHCYAVHRRAIPALLDYMRSTLEREPGHPDGARLYIDAALTFFRERTPDRVHLVASPCLSAQRGSISSLNNAPWYDRNAMTRGLMGAARAARDEAWRLGLGMVGPQSKNEWASPDYTRHPATPWPA